MLLTNYDTTTNQRQTMTPNTDDPDKRIFDVAKPGKTAASAQSRPVIVGHRTLLQDPMVKPSNSEDAKEEAPKTDEPTATSSPSGHTITPPQEQSSSPTPAAKPEENQQNPNTEEETKPPEQDRETSVYNGPAALKEQTRLQQQAELAKQENLHKLVDDKRYYVPIGEQKRSRTIRHLLLALIGILLLAIILADLLVDTGIIKTSVKPPVQIFHNNK